MIDDDNLRQMTDAQTLLSSREPGKVERLLEGLTNWNFDVNFAASGQMNQTLLHLATQVLYTQGFILVVKGRGEGNI